MRRSVVALSGLVCAGVLAGCTAAPTGSPPPTVPSAPSPTSSSVATATPSPSPTPSASGPPAAAASPSSTPTADPTVAAQPSESESASATPSPSPTRTKSASVPAPDNRPAVALPANPIGMSPLTGRPIGSYKPVLVVKLDNTPNAQPHAGLIDADVVYIEEVEYGITRLAAVFSSSVPRRIGPVRSARITDIDLLAQYGKPAFGYSGAQRKMFPYIKAASLIDVSPYTSGTGYSRDNGRRIPYNLFFDGRAGVKRAPKATPARDMGFVFDEQVPEGGLNATDASMRWGYASAGFDYDRKNAEYRVSLNGRPARAEEWSGGQRAATVVIQYVKQKKSQFWDKGGGNTPHAETIGTGTAMVLRDGRVWKTTWTRPNAKSGTTFTLRDGTLLPFKPGQLWVVLLDRKRPASITPLTKPKAAKPKPTPTAKPAPTPLGEPSPAPSTSASPDASTDATPDPTTGASTEAAS